MELWAKNFFFQKRWRGKMFLPQRRRRQKPENFSADEKTHWSEWQILPTKKSEKRRRMLLIPFFFAYFPLERSPFCAQVHKEGGDMCNKSHTRVSVDTDAQLSEQKNRWVFLLSRIIRPPLIPRFPFKLRCFPRFIHPENILHEFRLFPFMIRGK